MDVSVSLPDPGEFHRGHQNGHTPGLVIDQLSPFDPSVDDSVDSLDETGLRGDGGVLSLDAADIAEVLAAPSRQLTPHLVDEQTRLLVEELRAELDNDADLLPGFDALTFSDLDRARFGRGNLIPDPQGCCPVWCADKGLPTHGDGFDTAPEDEIPHRGVPHDIPTKHGGKSLDHTGRAEVSLQAEQERDLATGPVITLSVVVRGIEQYAWLTTTEATALHRTLGQILDDTNRHS